MPGLQYRLNKYFLLLTILSLFVLLWGGCSIMDDARDFISGRLSSDDDMDEVVEVVGIFFDLLVEKDYEQAYTYVSSRDREMNSQQDFIREFSDVTDIVKVEINWVEVKNNIALVGIDLMDSYDGEQKMYKDIEVSLVKEEDGAWKIVFWD